MVPKKEQTSIIIKTPRLILREFNERDTEALFSFLGDPEVMRFSISRADTSVPIRDAEMLAAAAGNPHRLIEIEDSPHCFWIGEQSEIVQDETIAWLEEWLLDPG